MTPRTEPNSIPPLFADVRDWRETYTAYAEEFKSSPKNYSDEVRLSVRLKRLGFVGVNLNSEVAYIKENT